MNLKVLPLRLLNTSVVSITESYKSAFWKDEKSIGLELNFNKNFYLILIYVAIFPAIAAYYFWQKGVEIIGPNRASMFIQLMPLFSAIMAIIFFEEIFELYHFVGAIFILSGIYLSNKKVHA